MHYLFGIIVRAIDREDAMGMAEDILDNQITGIYDWRDEDGAGRWSDEFEDNVISATDSLFDETVDRLIMNQELEYNECRRMMKDLDYYDKMYRIGEDWEFSAYSLKVWAKLVEGEPMANSYIFSEPLWTTRITKKLRDMYKEQPENYYLVLFDIHN